MVSYHTMSISRPKVFLPIFVNSLCAIYLSGWYRNQINHEDLKTLSGVSPSVSGSSEGFEFSDVLDAFQLNSKTQDHRQKEVRQRRIAAGAKNFKPKASCAAGTLSWASIFALSLGAQLVLAELRPGDETKFQRCDVAELGQTWGFQTLHTNHKDFMAGKDKRRSKSANCLENYLFISHQKLTSKQRIRFIKRRLPWNGQTSTDKPRVGFSKEGIIIVLSTVLENAKRVLHF